MERTVTPAECALAVALPLGEDEFLRDATEPDKDFARSMAERTGRAPSDAWREVYAPKFVAPYQRVAGRARALGATVVPGVTAAVLGELAARFPVVSLFAHAMATPVRAADIVDPRSILDAVRRGASVVARHLQGAFAARSWASDDDALRDQVAEALAAALAPSRAWSESTVRTDAQRPDHYLHRVLLEDSFGAAMRRAPLIELHDGLKTMDQLLVAVPAGFDGVLDLSVCNSVAIGESIKRQRRACLVVENVFLARADVRLTRYALVLHHLARAPARYTDALTDVNRHLIKGRS